MSWRRWWHQVRRVRGFSAPPWPVVFGRRQVAPPDDQNEVGSGLNGRDPRRRPQRRSSRSTGGRRDQRRSDRAIGRRSGGHPAFTPEAMHRAWRTVRANGGGAGVDGVTIAAFERDLDDELARLRRELMNASYRPRAVRRVYVPKPKEGLRPLAIWALRDRVAQRVVYDFTEPFFEPYFLPCSHGFRPERSVGTAVQAVLAARDSGRRWVLDADIKNCFEGIRPRQLMHLVRMRVKDRTVLRLLETWLAARILDAQGRETAAGTAQGGPLSPLLCNVYLHQLDVEITRRPVALVRYADDFVCLCRRKRDAWAAHRATAEALGRLGLELHPQKTRVVHLDQGLKFLGVFFLRGEHFYLGAHGQAQGYQTPHVADSSGGGA